LLGVGCLGHPAGGRAGRAVLVGLVGPQTGALADKSLPAEVQCQK
jgi:hypothetical protein